ncbi:hypothetical protein V8F20_001255 [Naviculisporaceae sp. PSN 640]
MHISQIITMAASGLLAQKALAASVLVYTGRGCTGDVQDIHIIDNTCANAAHGFKSYKENGWGSRGQRLNFNRNPCGTVSTEGKIYSTWAYDGDYFHSNTCYNIWDHNGVDTDTAVSIRSLLG